MISESPDKKWQVRVDEEGKSIGQITKHIYGKYSIEEILEAMDTNLWKPEERINPKPYNTLGKKVPKSLRIIGCSKTAILQHWDKNANGKRGGWRPKKV